MTSPGRLRNVPNDLRREFAENRLAHSRRCYERDGGMCVYCGTGVRLESMAVDHVVPLSRSGTNVPENLVTACKSCNAQKSDRLPHEWLTEAEQQAEPYVNGMFWVCGVLPLPSVSERSVRRQKMVAAAEAKAAIVEANLERLWAGRPVRS